MSKLFIASLTVALSMATFAMVAAQPPGGPGGPGFGRPGGIGGFGRFGSDKLMLMGLKQVQDELQVDEKQRKQIENRLAKQRESMMESRLKAPDDIEKDLAKQARGNDVALGKLLDKKQYQRLSEISVQQRGTRALADLDVAKALALTSPQKKLIERIVAEARAEMPQALGPIAAGPGGPGGFGRQGFGGPPGGQRQPQPEGGQPGANRPPQPGGQAAPGERGRFGRPQLTEEQRAALQESMKKIEALQTSTDEKLLAVLTETQQAKWQEMQGEPFKLEMGFGGPGGRNRGDRPGGPERGARPQPPAEAN